jgi:hypothetical protein
MVLPFLLVVVQKLNLKLRHNRRKCKRGQPAFWELQSGAIPSKLVTVDEPVANHF